MDWLILGLAGFCAGMLNAVAGGGSFITLPALIFVGVSSISANATGTAALLPGYIASAWRFRRDIEFPAKLSFKHIVLTAIIGGSLGAAILLRTSEQLFSELIPWLILFATLAFILGPWLLDKKNASVKKSQATGATSNMEVFSAGLILLAICVYGGYFNGGLGIILLAAFGLMGQTNLHGMNGLKNVISALLTAVAVVVYAAGGAIDVEHLLLLGIMAVAGGYVGAAFAYRISQRLLRVFIVFVGLFISVAFFLRQGI
jgi:uncharacterized membrane protein YfcA